jgi:F-type H+-transporting ATPase subunit a
MFSRFLAAGESGIHISLKAEPITQIGPLTVTNSMIYGLVCAVIIGAILVWSARKIKINGQKGFSQIPEMIVDFVLKLLESPLGSREKAVKYAPIFGTYFLFIIFTNLLALLPLVGPGFSVSTPEGSIPLFRPFTADLNGTIAMSVIAIVMVQVLSIKEQGGKKHLQHYFSDKPWNPISFFIGILEVFGEFTRMLSLSLRLFLNTAVGEILIAVFTSMIAANGRTPLAVLPILLFEMLVAAIQAYVFTILCATYLGLAISHAHDDHDDNHHSDTPKKVEAGSVSGD